MSVGLLAARLPEIDELRRRSISLAVLDMILSPEWEYRYYSFDPQWSEAEEMASMRNGSGDEYTIVFSAAGVFLRGFDHESPLSPWAQSTPAVVPGLVEGVPPALGANVHEPAFSFRDVPSITVCLWREASDDRWHFGEPIDPALRGVEDGSDWMFDELDGRPETYAKFALDYFEEAVAVADIAAVYAHEALSEEFIRRLHADVDSDAVLAEIAAMGYPTR